MLHETGGQVTEDPEVGELYYIPGATVKFESNGGTKVDSQAVRIGAKLVTEPKSPKAEGYDFEGWYKEAECITAWDFDNDTVTAATVLYAKWVPEKSNMPPAEAITSLTKGKKKFTVKWAGENASEISGYQIRYSRNADFSSAKTVKVSKTTTKKVVKKLKKKKTYYVQLRTYVDLGNAIYFSDWSEAKMVKTK